MTIELQFSVDHNSHVPALLQKLHDLLPFTSHLSPGGSGFRILFEAAEIVTFELKVHFAQFRLAGAPDRKTAMVQCHAPGIFRQSLLPD